MTTSKRHLIAMKPWVETERQGPGRRYWFATVDAAGKFYHARVVHGRGRGFVEGRTVWLAYTRKWTPAVAQVMWGVDPTSVR